MSLKVSVTRSGIFFYQIRLDGLGHPPCFKDLQYLEQEGVVPLNLSSFGKIHCIYGHTGKIIVFIMFLTSYKKFPKTNRRKKHE